MYKVFTPKTSEALLREIKDLKNGGRFHTCRCDSVFPPSTLLFESVEQETETVYLFHGMYHPSHLRDSTLIRLSISCYFRGPKKSMSSHSSSLIFLMNSLSLFISCSQFLKNTIWYLKKKN